ncbi:MAG: Firmicu-CTERM sorting domain-containing protein, partial [Liquorilactobacillus hordei]|uniref:Firmicu-CTERM sorting domain-containing protein n=1 Tax=Liquorilactobacillus hordei TaxID=468911 RepID=UPI0039EB43B1
LKWGTTMKKVLLILSFVFALFFFSNLSVYADSTSTTNIKIDGSFDDWNNVAKTKVGSGSYYNEAAVVEGNTVYVYVDTKDYPWGYIPTWGGYTINVGGNSYYANFSGGSSNFTTTGSSNSANFGTVGTGVEVQENQGQTKMFEFSYSLSKMGISDLSNQVVTVSNLSMGTQAVKAENIGTSTSSDSSSSSSSSNSSSGASSSTSSSSSSSSSESKNSTGEYTVGNYNIVIDGSFSDWKDITKTDIYFNYDLYNIKEGAMVSDGTYLYIYIRMDYTVTNDAYNHLQASGYVLTVGGTKYDLTIVNPGTGTPVTNNLKNVGDTQKVGIDLWNGAKQKNTIPSDVEGMAAKVYGDKNAPTDAVELKIPLSDLTTSSQSGQIITLKNANLGDQTLTISGGSTGPIILAVIGLIIAVVGGWKFNERRNRKKV